MMMPLYIEERANFCAVLLVLCYERLVEIILAVQVVEQKEGFFPYASADKRASGFPISANRAVSILINALASLEKLSLIQFLAITCPVPK